jgi:hypothetical protein
MINLIVFSVTYRTNYLSVTLFFYIPLTLFIEEQCISSRTLMFDGIPQNYCKKDLIIRHFQEAYPTGRYPVPNGIQPTVRYQ